MSKTLDPGATYQVQNRTDQVLDQYGNVTSMSLYDFGAPNGPPPGTPSRTYTNTYLNDSGYNHPAGSNYVAQHINNRLATSTVQGATGPATTLVSNNYDMTPPADSPGITQHDPAYNTGYIFRGNVTSSSGVGGTMSTGYDIAGNNPSTNVNGLITTAGFNTGTNYAAPSSITTNSLTTTLNWTAYLALGSETGPNGDSASMTYDGALRPATSTSSFGAVTTFSYSGNIKTATTNGHWVKTSVDGLGRTVKTETGDGASTKSVVDTVYAACGCTPLGKVSQVSQPHAPGATQYWTTYAYDATGRTTSVTAPDGSVTRYEYSANTVKVTDPAAKWKKFTMDAFGNLTSVLEPDPQLGNVTTSYSYDVLNHLSQVSMPRNGVTQTRTFNYGTPAGALLLSATNPENGTVTYTYNSDMTLATKTDAKNQQTQYSYDNYKRVYQVRHYPVAGGAEDTSQQVNYYYDSNPDDGGTFSQYVAGRLAVVKYGAVNIAGLNIIPKFAEWYSYNQPGGITAKRLQISETIPGSIPNTTTLNFDGQYTYDGEGKLTSVSYPSTFTVTGLRQQVPTPGPTYTYSFDTMSRPVGLTDQNSATLVSGVSYGPANELLGITYLSNIETRTYNNRLQLTNITAPGLNVTYNYTAGANNGKIVSANDNGELIQYTYDSLNRLYTAAFVTGTQRYDYDGFGNLTAKAVVSGSVPTMFVGVDANTNRLVGQNISYDANGNQTNYGSYVYDIENRLYTIPGVLYAYDARNKRVWKGTYDGSGNLTSQEVYFYGIDGSKLGTYSLQLAGWYNDTLADSATDLPVYFGSKNISMVADRLGSRRYKNAWPSSFYPYGEDKGTPVANDQIKFATYTRDALTGLDYADQRYYSSAFGRFMTPDPYRASPRLANNPAVPQSWNRYSYTASDPANRYDPSGTCFLSDEENGDHPADCSGGEDTSDGGGMQVVGDGVDHSGNGMPLGLALAFSTLQKIATADFKSKQKCRDFFNALVVQNHLKVSVDSLMDAVVNGAKNAMPYIYDGPSSTTQLGSEAFPHANERGANTVGEWFKQVPTAEALSQFNGWAIFIRVDQWEGSMSHFRTFVEGTPNAYGFGTLVHELLHKQMIAGGFIHDALGTALNAVGMTAGNLPDGRVGISFAIGAICF